MHKKKGRRIETNVFEEREGKVKEEKEKIKEITLGKEKEEQDEGEQQGRYLQLY